MALAGTLKDFGIADILPQGTRFEWSATYRPRSPSHLLLLQRN